MVFSPSGDNRVKVSDQNSGLIPPVANEKLKAFGIINKNVNVPVPT